MEHCEAPAVTWNTARPRRLHGTLRGPGGYMEHCEAPAVSPAAMNMTMTCMYRTCVLREPTETTPRGTLPSRVGNQNHQDMARAGDAPLPPSTFLFPSQNPTPPRLPPPARPPPPRRCLPQDPQPLRPQRESERGQRLEAAA